MFGLRAQELIIILLIVVVLFGAKKIPEMMKGFGKGIREFKKGMAEDDKPEDEKQEAPRVAKDAKPEASNVADKPENAKPAVSNATEVKNINNN